MGNGNEFVKCEIDPTVNVSSIEYETRMGIMVDGVIKFIFPKEVSFNDKLTLARILKGDIVEVKAKVTVELQGSYKVIKGYEPGK